MFLKDLPYESIRRVLGLSECYRNQLINSDEFKEYLNKSDEMTIEKMKYVKQTEESKYFTHMIVSGKYNEEDLSMVLFDKEYFNLLSKINELKRQKQLYEKMDRINESSRNHFNFFTDSHSLAENTVLPKIKKLERELNVGE